MPHELTVQVRFEDGALWATIDEYPGVFATGDTIEELQDSLAEGLSLVLSEPGGPAATVRLGNLVSQPVATHASAELVLA